MRRLTARPSSPKTFTPTGRVAAALSLLVVAASAAAAQAQAAPVYEELPGFRRVGEWFYRGAQPRAGGIRKLAELGINTVVNLRHADARARAEEAEARSLGLRFYNVELPAWGRPGDREVRRVLEIIEAPESGRVFVHCKDGVDRTGTVVACYRIARDGWTARAAEEEARQRGMRRHQLWMRAYIGDFEAARGEELDDRIGAGVRVGEIGFRRGQRVTEGAVRKGFGSVKRFLKKVG